MLARRHFRLLFAAAGLVGALLVAGCGATEGAGGDLDGGADSLADAQEGPDTTDTQVDVLRPEGWTEETHSNEVEANYEVVFAPDTVKEISLVFEAADWQSILADMTDIYGEFGAGGGPPPKAPPGPGGGGGILDYRNSIWIPCTVQFNGLTWTRVGFRFKGASTLMQTWQKGSLKLPFKLDLDQFEDTWPEIHNQRLYGFKRLSFSNNHLDNSYLRDKVGADLFREAGVPSNRNTFVRLSADFGEGPQNLGIYTLAEVPDNPMLKAVFGNAKGNLYKPEDGAASWESGLTVDDESFSKESNEDADDWSDVEAALAALHADRSDAAAWREALEARFNMDGFLKWLAINTVLQDWDTYGKMAHNYYLYGNPDEAGRLHWIPWDHNESMQSGSGQKAALALSLSAVTDAWPLIRFAMDDPVYSDLYWQYVNDFVQGTYETTAVKARLQAAHDLIAPYLEDPEVVAEVDAANVSATTFNAALATLFTHVDNRHSAVTAALQSR